jgi:hypothetical protein
MVSSEGILIMSILSLWEDRGVYCVEIENLRNSECAKCIPEKIDMSFFPSLHVCKLASNLMHFIKIRIIGDALYVIPLIKKEINGKICLVPEPENMEPG